MRDYYEPYVSTIQRLIRLKMEPDKEHIRHCLLFCFHQRKNAADVHGIIRETYDENISHWNVYELI